MDFLVLSRQQSELIDPTKKHIIISITDPFDVPANLFPNDNCKGILQLSFHDIDSEVIADKHKLELFTREQARKIFDFVDENINDIELIIVACEVGISISSSVAAFLSEIYNGHDSGFFRTHIPNRFVFKQLMYEHENLNIEDMFV